MNCGLKIKEYLDVLELSSIETLDENTLKRAYLKMSKKYHPDVCDEAYKDGVMFKKVNEANDYLKNNLETVNNYLKNPNAYNYEENVNVNNTYTYNQSDIFSEFFKAYQSAFQNQYKTYSEEEIKKIKKERKRAILKRKICSLFGVISGSLMCIISPAFGIFIIFFSLISLF